MKTLNEIALEVGEYIGFGEIRSKEFTHRLISRLEKEGLIVQKHEGSCGAFRHKFTGELRYTLDTRHNEEDWEDVHIIPMLAVAPRIDKE